MTIYKKCKRRIGAVCVLCAAVLIFSSVIGVFAYETGDKIQFKHKLKGGSYDHFTTADGYEGTCAQIGKTSPDSGTATVTKLDKSNKITKIAYYYGYKKGWSNNMEGYKGWVSTYGEVYSHLLRVAYMGFSDWESGYRAVAGGNDPSAMIAEVKKLWNGVDDLDAAPDNFQCLLCDQGSSQAFVLMKPSPPTGFVTVKKVSGNTSITG